MTLEERAQLAWPNSEAMQKKWIIAVHLARTSKYGWRNDASFNKPIPQVLTRLQQELS